ncbi:ABC transporter substrate-binding protein [Paenibacillus ihuae]|uniref:ABC transporter substrate-binding protein n=1 Tax=Paenibacillus ihuae TaxID=1232431 RepID=UPI0006D59655|nr:ABC transporter substrate-binding protein [Paenibacillus ihuae]
MHQNRKWLAPLLAFPFVLSACGGSANELAEATATSAGNEASKSPLEEAYNGDYKGKTVTVYGKMIDIDAAKLERSFKAFEDKTGVDVQYEGSQQFDTTISVRVDGGNAPDIANFSQPGLLANFAEAGKVVDVSTFLDMDKVKANYNQSWLDMTTMDSPSGKIMAGIWHRVSAKSLVWYNKKEFDAAGYQVPNTWDELIALSNQMVEDGISPWSIGIESEASTGWVATDWIEDILLRTTSLDNYDKWTQGELPFTSEEVKHAAELLSDIWFNPDYVEGGVKSIVSTSVTDAANSLFEPNGSMMFKMPSFANSMFPQGTKTDDYDFFYFPPIDEQYGKPVLVGGEIMAMFNDRPEVRALMEYFTTGESLKSWIEEGGVVSPHKDADLSWYTNKVDRGVAEIIQNADTVRFDASDLMPAEVGSGTFWKGMTDYVGGAVDLDQALNEIQAGWKK